MRYTPALLALIVAFALAACADTEIDTATEEAELGAAERADTATAAGASWSYRGEAGPEAWGTLSGEYAACETGQAQSPIALESGSAEEADLPALQFNYDQASLEVEETSYGYKAMPDDSHTLQIGGDSYRLLQFHPHTPSEHAIDGELYPMTLHFVHQNEAGELAVVGAMVQEGADSQAYEPFVEAARSVQQDSARVESLSALLPSDRSYFTYDGSLTTPPCTEGVRWIVLREPVTLSEEQIEFFEAHGETNRPLQPLGDRTVRVSS